MKYIVTGASGLIGSAVVWALNQRGETDILAVDQACVDMIYAMTEDEHHDLIERMESRHGLRQLSYMKELGMGNDRYTLIDIDNNDAQITVKDAVKGLKPFQA